jgi:hypothetical protein
MKTEGKDRKQRVGPCLVEPTWEGADVESSLKRMVDSKVRV